MALLVFLVLGSCSESHGDKEIHFDGKPVCLAADKLEIFSPRNIEVSGFDHSAEILKVTYSAGDPLFDHLVDNWGAPQGNIDYLSYSLMKLTEVEMIKYASHPLIKEAFQRIGSFKGAVTENIKPGFIKVHRAMETYSWQVFSDAVSPQANAFDLWVGDCLTLSNSLQCSYFEIYQSYLLKVDLAENFLLAKPKVKKSIALDIETKLFCESFQ
jgi:hypothetical protein